MYGCKSVGTKAGKFQKIGSANRQCRQHIVEEAAQPSSTVEEPHMKCCSIAE